MCLEHCEHVFDGMNTAFYAEHKVEKDARDNLDMKLQYSLSSKVEFI